MPKKRKKYDREFCKGAVWIVEETNKPIAQIAHDLGVNEGTLSNWVARAREAVKGTQGLSKDNIKELKRLRTENPELRIERDALKRSVLWWVSGGDEMSMARFTTNQRTIHQVATHDHLKRPARGVAGLVL